MKRTRKATVLLVAISYFIATPAFHALIVASWTITVTADFASETYPARPRATGFLFGIQDTTPSDASILELMPMVYRFNQHAGVDVYDRLQALSAGLPRPVCPVVILSDRFGYPPWNPGVVDRPGKDGNWTAWEAFVAGEVASNLAKGRNGTAIFYDIWNEPDFHQFWDGTFDEFMETWYRGAVAIRNLDPGAMLVGPSVAFFNTTRVTTFLDYIVERNATLLPNVLTWHEVNNRVADYESHAIQMRQLVEGNANYSSISQVHLHEYGVPEVLRVPGPNVHAISAIDRAQVDGATRAIFSAGGWHDDTMNDLLTTDLEPTPVWHAYKAYASMSLYGGSMVRVQLAHEAVDGMVSWNDLGEIRCLLGNKEERHLAVRLVLDNIGARIAGVDRYRARIYEIPHDHAPALASMPLAGEALIDVHASPVSTFLSMAPLSALYVTFEPA